MKRIMNRIRVFQLVCLAVLAVLCGGCYFTVMTAAFGGWGDGSGGSPGTEDYLLVGALDLVTAPAQVAFVAGFLVYGVGVWVDDLIGVGAAKRRFYQRRRSEMEEVRTAFAQDPDIIFSDARFFSSENTPQREVLIDFISQRGGDLSKQQVVSVAWLVMGKPGLLPSFAPLCARPELMDVQRKWCIEQSVVCLTNRIEDPMNCLLRNPALTDEELDRLVEMNLPPSLNRVVEDRPYGRRAREKQRLREEELRWAEEVGRAGVAMNRDFYDIFKDDRFFSLTNTPQREVLVGEFSTYNRLTTQQVARVVWRIMETPELLPAFAPICHHAEMPRQQRLWCLERSLEWAEKGVADPLAHMMENPALTIPEQDRILGFLSSWRPPNEGSVPSRVRSIRSNWEQDRSERQKRQKRLKG